MSVPRPHVARSIRKSVLALAILVTWGAALFAPLAAEAHDSTDLRGLRGHFDPTRLLRPSGSFRSGGGEYGGSGAPDAAPLAQASQGPDAVGQWSARMDWPLVAVHMAMQPTGEVLAFDAWEQQVVQARLWNPDSQTFTDVPNPSQMFCAGQAMLGDGRLLVAGGHTGVAGYGIKDVSIFDPFTRTWTRAADMHVARWYPTVTTLRDGRVLVTGGTSEVNVPSLTPEIYDPATNTWTELTGASLDVGEYPEMHPLQDGRVFLSVAPDGQSRILDPATQSWSLVGGVTRAPYGPSVVYRPGKVMVAGGDPDPRATGVIDLNDGAPIWRATAPMAYPRVFHNLVLMPDGKVLAVGGSTYTSLISRTGTLPAEMWDPATETWTTLAPMQDLRMYHSTAVLLPDGRVLSAGGGRSGDSVDYPSAQIYSPPYLFKGPRPTIASAPATVTFGATMTVGTPDAADIASVSFIRLGATTHAVDMDQRFAELTFDRTASGLAVHAPADPGLAPAGYYMMFLVNSNGVPSVAQIVGLNGSAPLPTPTSAATAPASGPGRVDTAVSDFTACGLPAGLTAADEAGGELRRSAALEDYFNGPLSSGLWSWGSWNGTTYSPAPAGGALPVQSAGGAWLRSAVPFSQQTLEGRVSFGPGPWQHVGFADQGFASSYAILSTAEGGGTLYARTFDGVAETRTALPTVALGGYHDLRIAWGAGAVDYYVDGAPVAHHPVALGGALYVYASNNGPAALGLDFLRVASYAPGASVFVSCVKDAGASGAWGQLAWDAQVPAGTGLALETRSSVDGLIWSDWAAVAASGGAIGSPAGRYLQYRATLTSSATDSPRLDLVRFTTAADPPIPTATATPIATPTETATPTVSATPSPTATTSAAAPAVTIADFAFQPNALTVQVGQTVSWTNSGLRNHTATSDTGLWDSGTLAQGGSFSFAFGTPGTYAYHCSIHPSMTGTIVVAGPPTATPTPSPTATPLGGRLDTTAADFASGQSDALVVADEAGGELRRPAVLEDYFDQPVTPSLWTWGSWSGGSYAPAPAGGDLTVQSAGGAWLRSAAPFSQQALEGRVAFGAGPWQHVGWADQGFATRWAILSTAEGDGLLYARTFDGVAETRTALIGVGLGTYHDLRIAWGASSVDYYVDGALMASHPVSIAGPMYASASDNGAAPLRLDFLRVADYLSGVGTYVSSVKDVGAVVTWGLLSWESQTSPNGTIALETRSSVDGLSWSAWAPVPQSGSPIASPPGRYLQYRVTLTNHSPSPRVDAVSFTTSADPATSTPTPTSTATATASPTTTPTARSAELSGTVSTSRLDTTVADLAACGVTPLLDEAFDGPLAAATWLSGSWTGAPYVPAPAGGVLAVQSPAGSAWLRSTRSFVLQSLYARASFGAGPWQHLGWADDGFVNRWAMFSTAASDSTLYARTFDGVHETMTPLLGVTLNAYHETEIVWQTSQVDYYVDGVLVASHPAAIAGPMYLYASNNSTAATLTLDSARLPTGLAVGDEAGGELRRPAAFEDYFDGALNPALWRSGS
ncbi:MAG TPA: galactose oxidase-like domain-containing protein, partial [Chloroflexota bacterium]